MTICMSDIFESRILSFRAVRRADRLCRSVNPAGWNLLGGNTNFGMPRHIPPFHIFTSPISLLSTFATKDFRSLDLDFFP
jgi:hypothetical protein